jgi:acyl carrier protein
MRRRRLLGGLSLLVFVPSARAQDPSGVCMARVRRILVETFGVPASRVTWRVSLRDDLRFDDLDVADFVAMIGDVVGVRVETDVAADGWVIVGDAVRHLERFGFCG